MGHCNIQYARRNLIEPPEEEVEVVVEKVEE